MKYYLDTEFVEGVQTKNTTLLEFSCWLGKKQKPKPTIDLISIGIVAEDNREYYAISKDFNLGEAWYRYQIEKDYGKPQDLGDKKVYWLRDNVIIPLCKDIAENDGVFAHGEDDYFTYKRCKKLINKYGKTKEKIAEEVKEFVYYTGWEVDPPIHSYKVKQKGDIQFYGYYADYDWVVFCWLFGRMIDLPKGFPMYCIDLKQTMDEKANSLSSYELSKLAHSDTVKHNVYSTYDKGILKCNKTDLLKKSLNYPKQTNEHNALADAVWNKKLHEFLNRI